MGHWCLEPDDYSYIVIIRSLQNNSELTILTFMTALISLHSNIKPLSFYCAGKPPEDLLTLLIVANKFIKIAGTLHSQMLIISDSQHWQSSWEEFTANQNFSSKTCTVPDYNTNDTNKNPIPVDSQNSMILNLL